MRINKTIVSSAVAFVCNLILAYLAYAACRVVYVCENWSTFSDGFGELSMANVLKGSWMFDTTGIMYTNILYALLMLCLFISRRETVGKPLPNGCLW